MMIARVPARQIEPLLVERPDHVVALIHLGDLLVLGALAGAGRLRSRLRHGGFVLAPQPVGRRLEGEEAKQDQTQFKLLVKQMIVELEDVLRVLKA